MKLPRTGETFDSRYRMVRELGWGRAHVVLEASHLLSGRPVAIKVPRPEMAERTETREGLLREVRALGAIRHFHVVELYDAGITDEGVPYAVTELLDGSLLDALFAAGAKPAVADAVALARQLAVALAAIHARGYTHGDVRVGNLFLARAPGGGDERLKLLDFDRSASGGAPYGDGAREDVRAAGGALAEWVAGADLPADLAALVERAVSPTPGSRYADAAQLLAALDATGLASARTTLLARVSAPSRTVITPSGQSATRASGAVPIVPPPLRRPVSQPGVIASQPAPRSPGTPGMPFVPAAPRAAWTATQRGHARAEYVTPVRLTVLQGTIDGRTEDVSEGGIQVVVPRPMVPGDRAQLRFALPGTGKVATCPTVVRSVQPRPGEGSAVTVGLEFVVLHSTVREAIRQYIALTARPPG